MGSELWRGSERVWPNIGLLLKNPEILRYGEGSALTPRGIVDEVVIVPNLIKQDQYNRLGDYSYGVYIYAFPIQQSLLALWPNLRPLQLLGLALPITLAVAALSWHFVEQPALRAKQKLKGFKLSGRKNTLGAAVPDQGKPM